MGASGGVADELSARVDLSTALNLRKSLCQPVC